MFLCVNFFLLLISLSVVSCSHEVGSGGTARFDEFLGKWQVEGAAGEFVHLIDSAAGSQIKNYFSESDYAVIDVDFVITRDHECIMVSYLIMDNKTILFDGVMGLKRFEDSRILLTEYQVDLRAELAALNLVEKIEDGYPPGQQLNEYFKLAELSIDSFEQLKEGLRNKILYGRGFEVISQRVLTRKVHEAAETF